ncbi:hypothetical protein DH2020_043722 [Rehmannia glutinosa]|uniref:Uncharacterized protein n=1 Tax=Rehmannia glutinosa TaxID=99300 RepID=A0ABR0UIU9_REHGL
MGYVLRVRLASFFTGAALASAAGLYYLQKDYKIAHHAISQQQSHFSLLAWKSLVGRADAYLMNSLYESLDGRVSALEKLKEVEPPKHVDVAE